MGNQKKDLFSFKIIGYPRTIYASKSVLNYIYTNKSYTTPKRLKKIKDLYDIGGLSSKELHFLAYLHTRGMKDGVQLVSSVKNKIQKIMEIGGGIGASSLFLFQSLEISGTIPSLLMVEQKFRHVGGQTFNMEELIKDFMLANEIEPSRIQFLENSQKDLINEMGPFDLIYSFRSLSYHYPLEEYLPIIKKSIHSKSSLILDIRRVPCYKIIQSLKPTSWVKRKLMKCFSHTSVLFSSSDKIRLRLHN